VCEEAAHDAGLPLHGSEIVVFIAGSDGHAGDKVVENEVVEDDYSWLPPHGVDDPGVGLWVVADVVDGNVGAPR